MSRWVMALAAWLVLGVACRKDNKTEQLAALDNAYQSGVLSKAEYDAKRQALMGPPAASSAAATPAAPAAVPVQPNPAPDPTPTQPPAAAPSGSTPAPAPPPGQTLPAQPPPQARPARPIPPQPSVPPPAASETLPPADAAEPEPAPSAGCADTEYRSGKEKGAQERFYPAPVEVVKRAAAEALRVLDFTIRTNAGDDLEATRRRHLGAIVGAGGERMILHFERARRGGREGTLVMGETKKSFVGRMAQKAWTNVVLAQIACHLRLPQ